MCISLPCIAVFYYIKCFTIYRMQGLYIESSIILKSRKLTVTYYMHKFSAKTLLHCSILLYNCVNAMHLYMVRVTQFHTHKHMCKLHGCSYIIVCV